jgi:hypothetical protein
MQFIRTVGRGVRAALLMLAVVGLMLMLLCVGALAAIMVLGAAVGALPVWVPVLAVGTVVGCVLMVGPARRF